MFFKVNYYKPYQHYVFSLCLLFLFQLGSLSNAGTAPTAPPRRATWRLTSSVSTASPLTTASTPTAASDAHTRPRGPPDCLRASREIIMLQEETRSAWHHSVGLDVVMATADTDSYDYCFSFTSKGLGWLRLKKKKKVNNQPWCTFQCLLEEPQYVFICSKEAAYNNKVHCDVKV